jgi:peptidoglycan/LPS O-acetylase OafA/YrhL
MARAISVSTVLLIFGLMFASVFSGKVSLASMTQAYKESGASTQVDNLQDIFPCNCAWSPTASANFQRFSGTTINELGFYDSCISYKDDSVYMLVSLVNKETRKPDLFWGICVAKCCSEQNVTTFVEPQMKIFTNYNPVVKNPDDPANQKKINAGFIGFFVFTGIMLVVVVISTYINQSRKHKEKLQKQRAAETDFRSTIRNVAEGAAALPITTPSVAVTLPTSVAVGTPSSTLGSTPGGSSTATPAFNLGRAKEHEKETKHKETPFFSLFDAITNIGSLIYPRIINPSVQVFDLLRVFAMVWVVVGHELAYRLSVSENFVDQGFLDYTQTSWYFTYNMSAFYAVDIFLFMGGYVAIVSLSKFINGFMPFTPLKIPVIYIFTVFKRYMRIMPAYGYLLWFWYSVAPAVIEGPLSPGLVSFYPCDFSNFWKSFILGWKSDINTNGMCAGWCWYLAVDFQVFLTIPIVLIISTFFGKMKKIAGIGIVSGLLVASLTLTIVTGYDHHIQYTNAYDQKKTMNTYYYAKSPQRAAMYYIGCLFAYMTMKDDSKKKPKHHEEAHAELNEEEKKEKLLQDERRKKRKIAAIKLQQNIYFAVALTGLVGITLLLHFKFQWGRNVADLGTTANVLFITFGKVVFVLSFMTVLLIIGFRFKGFGAYIAKNRLLQLVANLGFSMYLFHFTSIMIRTYSQKSIPTYAGQDLFAAALTDLTYTLVAAVICTLLVELPAAGLWRVYCEGVLLNNIKKLFKSDRKKPHLDQLQKKGQE